jgi:hypothetical protein
MFSWLCWQSSAKASPNANSLFGVKIQGNSAKTASFEVQRWLKTAATQDVSGQIPYAQEQGIFWNRAGNISARSGIEAVALLKRMLPNFALTACRTWV